MTGSWRTGMAAWCAGVAVFGLVLAGAAFPATDGVARALLGLMGGAPVAPFDPAMRFAVGLMGCVSLGWGLTLAAILAGGPGSPAMWRGVTLALLVWFVSDSAISVLTGFGLNAVSNTLLMAVFLALVFGSGALRASADRNLTAFT